MVAAVARAVVAVLVVAAVAANWVAVAPVRIENLFGFFTIQSNLIGAVVLAVGAVRLRRRTPVTAGWSVLRWGAATYLTVVGLVYWALLAPLGAAGGVPLMWANLVLHALTPAVAVLDLAVVRDARRPAVRAVPLVLIYPLVWTAVVLVRGATDGWVPYPFLDPAQGYGVVALWVVAVALAFAATALLLRLLLRRA